MMRREFITLLGGAAAWPLAARAQQPAMPVIGFIRDGTADTQSAHYVAAFRKGLSEVGVVEGQNVTVEYHWLEGRHDRLPALMDDLVRRQVAVMATIGNVATLAAKAATATIPIVFGVGEDPVRRGLVASFARPGGNATGINFLNQEVASKRLRLLHELVPNAVRVALLVNPANAPATETALRIVQEAAATIGLQIQILKASTSREIDAAFATIERERPDALFVSGDAFFISRAVQFATLTARSRIPATYPVRDFVEVGVADELRDQLPGSVSSSGRLYRQNPQRREAHRPAGDAVDEVRVGHQPSNCAIAGDRGAPRGTLHRRRGDRMM